MARILIKCPSCSEKGFIEISEGDLKDISRGLLAVNITENLVCSHSFIAYIDKNKTVRDYFIADFQVGIPEIVPLKEIEDKEIPGSDIIDPFLIKINLSATLITFIIKSIFHKQKVAIILDDLRYRSRLKYDILNFFKYITKDYFNVDISIILKNEFKNDKKKYKDYMVFEGNTIHRNLKKIINPRELKIEKHIVNRFFTEPESTPGLIFLKNEIHKAYELARTIRDYLNNYIKKENYSNSMKITKKSSIMTFIDDTINKEKFILKSISDHLTKKYKVKIHKSYLDFLLVIVKEYFEVDLQKIINKSI